MRCKHTNGTIAEYATIENIKIVRDGKVSEEGDNNIGNITGYIFECADCGLTVRFTDIPRQKWLKEIYNQL